MPGGVNSNVRMAEGPWPLFFQRGEGSRLYDVDGNEYIDYVLGQGPTIFGHAPDFLLEAVDSAMRSGQVFAAQHELEIKASEAVQRMVRSAELVRFAGSGTEAVEAALRVARAYTGRAKFIKFEGHYHGWSDSVFYSTAPSFEDAGASDAPTAVPMSAGMDAGTGDSILVLQWNDVQVLRRALDRHHRQIAAIITEPIMCNTNCIMPRPGYLEEMRRLCDDYGVVLIFDEVITGFRLGPGGAQEVLGVTPDLSTFGKALGGGFPISMLAGKREMMGLMGDGTVMHGGTFNSNVVSMAAVDACLERMKRDDGALYNQLTHTGRALMEGLTELAGKHDVDVLVQGPGPVFCMSFTSAPEITDYRTHRSNVDEEKYAEFCQGMLSRGVRLIPRGVWYVSQAHTSADIDKTLAAADVTLASI